MPSPRDMAQDGTGDLLARIPLFSDLTPDTLAALASEGHRRTWPAGATIFQRGDDGDHMLAVTEGRVRLTLGTAQGKELMLRQLGPWEVVGELAIIDGEPRSADAVAVDAVSAVVLPRAPVLRLARTRADLAFALARHLSSIIRGANLQMESIALYDLRTRLVRFFLFALREAHGDRPPAEARLRLNLSQTDLSAALGASRPKLNQALQWLIAEGAVRRDGADMICATRQLRELAEIDDPRDLP